MPATDLSLRPLPLLATNETSDFSRNFADLAKRCKRPYSIVKIIRALSSKPTRLDGFEMEFDQELRSLNRGRAVVGTLVPSEALANREDTVTWRSKPLQIGRLGHAKQMRRRDFSDRGIGSS
jgi:hypothetical protein